MQKSLGLYYEKEDDSNNKNQSSEELLTPIFDVLNEFRNNIRNSVHDKVFNFLLRIYIIYKDFKRIMESCDHIRDEVLPNFGVKIEDKGLNSVFFLINIILYLFYCLIIQGFVLEI